MLLVLLLTEAQEAGGTGASASSNFERGGALIPWQSPLPRPHLHGEKDTPPCTPPLVVFGAFALPTHISFRAAGY